MERETTPNPLQYATPVDIMCGHVPALEPGFFVSELKNEFVCRVSE